MQKEKIALIALVIVVVAALSVFVTATNTDIFENLFKEKLILSEGDCADVDYIGRYASNNTIFDTSYKYAENKSGGTPLKIFLKTFPEEASWKPGYTTEIIDGFREGLIGMKEGQTKIIGPIPPEKAYGANKLTEGAIFTTQYLAFGMNQTVIVTNYTNESISLQWIQMDNLTNFTMPQLVIKNLQSENETEMVLYPPPYYIWKNSTSIINITDTNVTVSTIPTKNTNLTDIVTDVRDGEKQMLIFPNATTASWTDTTITVVCSPQKGWNYTFQTQGYTGMVNVTIFINNITGDKINVTITNDQSTEPTYLDVYRTLTFNRTFVLPRIYKDIPSMYISYFYAEDIQKAGYSLEPLAGESLTFEVTLEKVYKNSQETS
jgi:FKBP-type peptidyl-prolyl cis-trans isomerase 2